MKNNHELQANSDSGQQQWPSYVASYRVTKFVNSKQISLTTSYSHILGNLYPSVLLFLRSPIAPHCCWPHLTSAAAAAAVAVAVMVIRADKRLDKQFMENFFRKTKINFNTKKEKKNCIRHGTRKSRSR